MTVEKVNEVLQLSLDLRDARDRVSDLEMTSPKIIFSDLHSDKIVIPAKYGITIKEEMLREARMEVTAILAKIENL